MLEVHQGSECMLLSVLVFRLLFQCCSALALGILVLSDGPLNFVSFVFCYLTVCFLVGIYFLKYILHFAH